MERTHTLRLGEQSLSVPEIKFADVAVVASGKDPAPVVCCCSAVDARVWCVQKETGRSYLSHGLEKLTQTY